MSMVTVSYNDVLDLAQQLDPVEQLRLLEALSQSMRRPVKPRQSILSLQGLGKEIWQGIDAQKYVEQERASWDG